MGKASSKLKKHLQAGDEFAAVRVYSQNKKLAESLDVNNAYGDNADKNTPLHLACRGAMKSLVKVFLYDKLGNPNKTNVNEETCLHLVCQSSPHDAVHIASQKRRADTLNLLLNWRSDKIEGKDNSNFDVEKVDINCTDKKHNTSLHYAASSGLLNCVKILVNAGCSLFVDNDDGLRAVDLAERNKHNKVAQFLEGKMVFSTMEVDDSGSESAVLSVEEDYCGLRAQDLQEAKDFLLVETADMLNVSLFTAERLLRNNEWSRETLLEAWFAGPEECCRKAGIERNKSPVVFDENSCSEMVGSDTFVSELNNCLPTDSPSYHSIKSHHDDSVNSLGSRDSSPDHGSHSIASDNMNKNLAVVDDLPSCSTAVDKMSCSTTEQNNEITDENAEETDAVNLLPMECQICITTLDEKPFTLPCCHIFCSECWESYLTNKITSGVTHGISCPAYQCDVLLPNSAIEKLVSREIARRYLLFDIHAFVDTNPSLKWCPHPGCCRAVKLPLVTGEEKRLNTVGIFNNPEQQSGAGAEGDSSHSVDCGAGHFFCWECGGVSHAPASCYSWGLWLQEISQVNPEDLQDTAARTEQAANCLWLVTNSKPCPNCSAPIQKNEGCNHMACYKCRHEFCWICQEPWKKHNSSTGGYFRCNRFEVVKKVEDKSATALSSAAKENEDMQKLSKFVHHFTRFKNHEHSYKLEEERLSSAKAKMVELAQAAMGIYTNNNNTDERNFENKQLSSPQGHQSITAFFKGDNHNNSGDNDKLGAGTTTNSKLARFGGSFKQSFLTRGGGNGNINSKKLLRNSSSFTSNKKSSSFIKPFSYRPSMKAIMNSSHHPNNHNIDIIKTSDFLVKNSIEVKPSGEDVVGQDDDDENNDDVNGMRHQGSLRSKYDRRQNTFITVEDDDSSKKLSNKSPLKKDSHKIINNSNDNTTTKSNNYAKQRLSSSFNNKMDDVNTSIISSIEENKLEKSVVDSSVLEAAEAETKFVEEAIGQLLKARRVLQCSYVYGYYLEESGYRRQVFDFMQRDLEEKVEELSQMICRPYLRTPKGKIIQSAESTRKQRVAFLHTILRGLIPPDLSPEERSLKRRRRRKNRRIANRLKTALATRKNKLSISTLLTGESSSRNNGERPTDKRNRGRRGDRKVCGHSTSSFNTKTLSDLISGDDNDDIDDDMLKLIMECVTPSEDGTFDLKNSWIKTPQGTHANIALLLNSIPNDSSFPTYSDDEDDNDDGDISRLHDRCRRVGCHKPRSRCKRTGQLYDFCSLRCVQLTKHALQPRSPLSTTNSSRRREEPSEERPLPAHFFDEDGFNKIDLLRAIELSRLQEIQEQNQLLSCGPREESSSQSDFLHEIEQFEANLPTEEVSNLSAMTAIPAIDMVNDDADDESSSLKTSTKAESDSMIRKRYDLLMDPLLNRNLADTFPETSASREDTPKAVAALVDDIFNDILPNAERRNIDDINDNNKDKMSEEEKEENMTDDNEKSDADQKDAESEASADVDSSMSDYAPYNDFLEKLKTLDITKSIPSSNFALSEDLEKFDSDKLNYKDLRLIRDCLKMTPEELALQYVALQIAAENNEKRKMKDLAEKSEIFSDASSNVNKEKLSSPILKKAHNFWLNDSNDTNINHSANGSHSETVYSRNSKKPISECYSAERNSGYSNSQIFSMDKSGKKFDKNETFRPMIDKHDLIERASINEGRHDDDDLQITDLEMEEEIADSDANHRHPIIELSLMTSNNQHGDKEECDYPVARTETHAVSIHHDPVSSTSTIVLP